jgi:hypothetical protein
MNKSNVVNMTMKMTPDVHEKLRRWAFENCTSMTAEFIRSVRERAERERERDKAVG